MIHTATDPSSTSIHGMARWVPRIRKELVVVCLTWAIFAGSGRTQDTSLTFVQRQQQAQQLAAQLVSGILDLQLRQLQENGLEHLPVYAEIKSMRRNIYELVDREMRQVVEQLRQADRVTGEPQELLRQQARAEIRQIVIRLMAERQKLEQRLQVSRLSAQARQLLDLQRRVHQATQSLSEQENVRRQQLAVAAIADQSDVIAVFEDLLGTLAQVRSWGGPRSGAAIEGLQLLHAGAVGQVLQHTVTAMQQADFDTAVGQQTTALQIFNTLLQRLDRDRGVDGANRTALLKQIRAIILLQESLREETRAAATEELSSDDLVERQTTVHQAITAIGDTPAALAAVKPLWQQAETAAFDAVEDLFSESKSAALSEQATVIGSLAQLADHLQQSTSDGQSEKSAHELSLEIHRLETLAKALNEATSAHHQWSRLALDGRLDNAQEATAPYAVQLPPLADQSPDTSTAPLPITVAAALQNAQDQAAALIQATSPPNPLRGKSLQQSAQQVEVALRQTQAEVHSYLTDLRRRHLSVEVGEVARAAESLERAAAAERILAQGAPLAINQSEQQREQQRITSVADDIARGVETSAPQVSAQLKALAPALATAAQQSRTAPAAGTIPSATHHAKRPALDPLATSLTTAAAALRKHQDQVATQLAALAASQTAQLRNARTSLEKEHPRMSGESQQTAGASLQQARLAVFAARVEQLRASGHRAAAEALATSGSITALTRQQRRLGFEHLDAFTTWSHLAIAQRQVTRMLEELEHPSSAAISATIAQATEATTRAARMALSGNRRGYRAEHQQTMTALSALQREMETLIEKHSQPLTTQFDLSAQLKVTTHTTSAWQAILNRLPEVVQVLQGIEARSQLTAQAIRDSQESTTHSLQKINIQELLAAERALRKAILETGQQEIASWEPLSRQIEKLAARAASIDAPATAALNQTLEAIQEGQRQSPQDLDHLAARQNSIERGMDRAAASLAARETRIHRDQQVAESLASLARDQQAAREDIEQYASRLNSMLAGNREKDDTHSTEITPEQTKVAADLAAATQRFAATQRSTGEGAVQISGQQQVANRAIRQGLATASRLRSASWSRNSSTQRQVNANSPEPPPDVSRDAQPTPSAPGNKADNSTQPGKEDAANASATGNDGTPGSDVEKSLQGLGTGLIPDSPETTAQQIAGPQASEAVARAQARRSSSNNTAGGESSNRQAAASSEERAAEGTQRPSAAQAGEAQAGQPGAARASLPGKANPQQATAAAATAAAAEKRLERAPWFAKLPPQLRDALRSRPRREAPRGYRERLRRYFQSID